MFGLVGAPGARKRARRVREAARGTHRWKHREGRPGSSISPQVTFAMAAVVALARSDAAAASSLRSSR